MSFSVETFLFDTPLYTKVIISPDDMNEFDCLIYLQYRRDIEGYNPWRKTQTTFTFGRQLNYNVNDFKICGGIGEVNLKCKRYGDTFIFYCFWIPESSILMKIGQFPSVADIHVGEIKKYDKLLSKEKLKEFTRAIGLSANGIGIGSFVYLRRIFEFLINEAKDTAIQGATIKEIDFQKARMDEKIELLKSYLPPFLVENKGMYSILSVGVHELDEDTCLKHFDTLRIGIEIILDEKLEEKKRKEKIEMAQKKLQELKGKL